MWISRVFVIASIFVCSIVQAQVEIKGNAPQYIGKEIMAFSYEDHFTKSLFLEDITKVDSIGNFTLSINSDATQMINLRCDYVNAHVYVQANSEYDILFPPLPSGQNKSINNTAKVDVFFNNLDEADINNQIINFNKEYNLFFENNLNLLARISRPGAWSKKDSTKTPSTNGSRSGMKIYQDKLAQFSSLMNEKFQENENDFFMIYRKSIEADMYQNTHVEPKFIYDTYIKPFSIYIKHPEQVNLLTNFYDNYFSQFDEKFGLDMLRKAINSDDPLNESLLALSKDDFLEDKTLSEIVLIYTLYSEWENKSLIKEKSRFILTEIASKGSKLSSKELAKNTLNVLSINVVGEPAYNFTLYDIENAEHRMDEFEGKYIVLEFWASWCQSCLKELTLSSRLSEQYKKDFDFISIDIEENRNDMNEYLLEHPALKQIFLHIGNDKLILDQFNIRSLPAYVIIDKHSNILISPAPLPSLHLEERLHKIKVSEKKQEIDNFDKN